MKITISVLLGLLFSLNVFAGSATITAEMSVMNAVSTYTQKDGLYEISSMTGSGLFRLTGSGAAEGLDETREINLAENLPDPSSGEFNRLSLERTGEQTANIRQQSLDKVRDATVVTERVVEVKLTSGTWADFDGGKEVQAVLTRRGQEQNRKANNKVAEDFAKAITAQLKENGVRPGSVRISLEDSTNDVMTLSKETIVAPQAYLKVKARVSAYVAN